MPTIIDPSSMANLNSTLTLNGSTFAVGYQGSLSNLVLPTSLHLPGISVSGDQITITSDNFVLKGVDFRGYHVVVRANNVTIDGCLADSDGYFTIQQPVGFNGLTVENSTFIGTKGTAENDDFVFSDGVANIHNNVFLYAGIDTIWISGGSVDHNYIGPGGYTPGGHADGITVAMTRGTPVTIQNNYIDWSGLPDARVGLNNAINITAEGGNINNVTVSNNVLLGGGYTVLVASQPYSLSNVKVINNQIGDWYWGPLWQGQPQPYLTFAGNLNFDTGAPLFTVNAPSGPTIGSFSPDSGIVGDGITNVAVLMLTGTDKANNTVNVYDGTKLLGTAAVNGSGVWSFKTSALADGSHSFTATDASAVSAALVVKVDTGAPAKPVVASFSPDTAPTNDGHTTATTLTLTGTGEANSTIQAFDGTKLLGTAAVNASGAWNFTTGSLTIGAHSFTATNTDAAGNISVASVPLAITVDSGGGGTPTNLVVNGGFETGNFTGWTIGPYQPEQTIISPNSHSGQFAAALGPAGGDGSLSQDLTTTPGQHYTLDFWLANMSTSTDDFAVKWGGTTVMELVNQPAQDYTEYKFDVVATSTTTHLEFDYRQDPTQWRLDDISLVAAASDTAPTSTTGTSGDDVLRGTSGADVLTGYAGNDIYTVNSTADKVVELANAGTDKVESTISYTLADNVENLQLMGDAQIDGAGNGLDNTIIGNDVSNRIEGNAGNDTLNGWGGKDTLLGGSGNDVFQFSSQFSADGDTVMDFVHGVDKLDFSKIDASAYQSGDQAFIFDGYDDGGSNGHLWAVEDQAAGVTHLYGKTGYFQFHIDLQGVHLGLTTSDFIL